MLDREERIRIILNECKNFSKISNQELNILNNIHGMLVNEVSGDVKNIYQGVSKDEMKEDVKILLDHVDDIKNEEYKEFLMEIIIKLTKVVLA
ncbi:MAG: hypothetical protein ACRCU6_09750 [Fusobacteriaceae bacterium]